MPPDNEVEVDPTGIEYFSDEVFEIEGLLDKKMVAWRVGGTAAKPKMKDYPMYLVLWKGWPPELASWQYPKARDQPNGIPRPSVDKYEAHMEAEAQLEAEEAQLDAEDEEEDEEEA